MARLEKGHCPDHSDSCELDHSHTDLSGSRDNHIESSRGTTGIDIFVQPEKNKTLIEKHTQAIWSDPSSPQDRMTALYELKRLSREYFAQIHEYQALDSDVPLELLDNYNLIQEVFEHTICNHWNPEVRLDAMEAAEDHITRNIDSAEKVRLWEVMRDSLLEIVRDPNIPPNVLEDAFDIGEYYDVWQPGPNRDAALAALPRVSPEWRLDAAETILGIEIVDEEAASN